MDGVADGVLKAVIWWGGKQEWPKVRPLGRRLALGGLKGDGPSQ